MSQMRLCIRPRAIALKAPREVRHRRRTARISTNGARPGHRPKLRVLFVIRLCYTLSPRQFTWPRRQGCSAPMRQQRPFAGTLLRLVATLFRRRAHQVVQSRDTAARHRGHAADEKENAHVDQRCAAERRSGRNGGKIASGLLPPPCAGTPDRARKNQVRVRGEDRTPIFSRAARPPAREARRTEFAVRSRSTHAIARRYSRECCDAPRGRTMTSHPLPRHFPHQDR